MWKLRTIFPTLLCSLLCLELAKSFNNCHVGRGKVNQHCNSATAAKHTLRYAEPITANKGGINGGISKEVNELKDESIGDTKTGLDDNTDHDNSEKQDAFLTLAENIKTFIIKSDLKRKDGGDGGGSSGWTSWADVSSSMELQKCVEMVTLSKPEHPKDTNELKFDLQKRDKLLRWMKWMKSTPVPMIVDISSDLGQLVVNDLFTDEELLEIDAKRNELLKRIGARIFVFPSGGTLDENIRTPAGTIVYAKLLMGGVRSYRLLGKKQRRTGERLTVQTNEDEQTECWVQFGGTERNYESVDMGPCALLEVLVMPKGTDSSLSSEKHHMTLNNHPCPSDMIDFYSTSNRYPDGMIEIQVDPLFSLTGQERNDFIEETFTKSVGGLQPQIQSIVRRVLDGRVFRPYDGEDDIIDGEMSSREGAQSLMEEARELEALGLTPVRGVLLYGPPGTGKTLLAREISNSLKARKPVIISAPELLDRWVGGSERMIRELFSNAELELQACGGDATKSCLHVIVIDEIDAVFRKRSGSEDSAQVTRASAVNQILSKLDGVNAIPNVLLIGMTNRRELLDDALLRPGRLEVQIKIPLPDKEGRREILQIQFEALRRKGLLSEPLCRAIDGGITHSRSIRSKSIGFIKSIRHRLQGKSSISDLALDSVTGGFSGADLAGLVRCAGSIALARARKQGMGVINGGLLITLEDISDALKEIKQ